MFFNNRCGRHHRRRRCGICGIFDCLCGRRRRHDRCDGGGAFIREREFTRADFTGFFPEARFEHCPTRKRGCGC